MEKKPETRKGAVIQGMASQDVKLPKLDEWLICGLDVKENIPMEFPPCPKAPNKNPNITLRANEMQAVQTKRKNDTVRLPVSSEILHIKRANKEALNRLKDNARKKREHLKRGRIKLATAYKEFLNYAGLTA